MDKLKRSKCFKSYKLDLFCLIVKYLLKYCINMNICACYTSTVFVFIRIQTLWLGTNTGVPSSAYVVKMVIVMRITVMQIVCMKGVFQ